MCADPFAVCNAAVHNYDRNATSMTEKLASASRGFMLLESTLIRTSITHQCSSATALTLIVCGAAFAV
jgi:hypothetical protein